RVREPLVDPGLEPPERVENEVEPELLIHTSDSDSDSDSGEVDPVSWTPQEWCKRRSPQWHDESTRRSFGDRSSSCTAQAVALPNWHESSSRASRRSATGSGKPRSTKAGAKA